jgi:cellulose synthase/poly-beta-1,6-N-acetylglucosamine synthase-like glycosyltransferase
MEFGVRTGAAIARSDDLFGEPAGSPSINPSAVEFVDTGKHRFARCPEIDCVRPLLARNVLAAVENRAVAIGVGADRVLIASGALSEETYLRALATALGVEFEPLDGVPRTLCPVNDERLIESAAAGLLPLALNDDLTLVVAPRGTAARRILRLIEQNPARAQRFRLTSAERLNRFVLRHAGKALVGRASDQIKQAWPILSAAPPHRRGNTISPAIAGLLSLAAVGLAPGASVLAVEIMLAAVFLAWLGLRLTGAVVTRPAPAPSPRLPDDALPVYTVICALYREAASVDGLLSAIERLDYPPEKLDVLIAVEADDRETHAAIAARKSRVPIAAIAVPGAGPRTKPKALNVALPFARGTFAVIFDAEDRPEPNQLRRALQAFRAGGDNLACVQAHLCIDNTADSWLARLYTAEYAGQFDVFLPGLAGLRLPLPLGGSSNHFHTATLREVRGWDPFNVTEDADLGIRLARFGYRTDTIDSTTYEEAPAYAGPWLRQRTRWFKGWMQTWLVHMRQPRRLLHDLGLPGFVTFQLIVGGSVLAALVHPLFIAGLIYSLASGVQLWRDDSAAVAIFAALYGASVVIGYLTSAFLGWLGLSRRGLLASAWVLVLTPAHWLLLSLAAWRALYQLIVAPYHWEKTTHGLARTSRLVATSTPDAHAAPRAAINFRPSGNVRSWRVSPRPAGNFKGPRSKTLPRWMAYRWHWHSGQQR